MLWRKLRVCLQSLQKNVRAGGGMLAIFQHDFSLNFHSFLVFVNDLFHDFWPWGVPLRPVGGPLGTLRGLR